MCGDNETGEYEIPNGIIEVLSKKESDIEDRIMSRRDQK